MPFFPLSMLRVGCVPSPCHICHQPASRWIDNGSQTNNSDGQATGVDLPPCPTFLSRWKLSLPSTVKRRFKLDSVSLNVSSSSPFSFPFNNGVPPISPITARRQTTQRWPYYGILTHQPLSMSRQRSPSPWNNTVPASSSKIRGNLSHAKCFKY